MRPPVLRLAGDIAAQFRHLPDDEAVAAIARHIKLFWDPRMRRDLARLAPDSDDKLLRAVASSIVE